MWFNCTLTGKIAQYNKYNMYNYIFSLRIFFDSSRILCGTLINIWYNFAKIKVYKQRYHLYEKGGIRYKKIGLFLHVFLVFFSCKNQFKQKSYPQSIKKDMFRKEMDVTMLSPDAKATKKMITVVFMVNFVFLTLIRKEKLTLL